MARFLRVSEIFLRLISAPFSGGSFGLKQSIYPYIVLLAAASHISGLPLKWTEDRLEHLMASSSAADGADELEAALFGRHIVGIALGIVNVGAYVKGRLNLPLFIVCMRLLTVAMLLKIFLCTKQVSQHQ